MDLDLHLAREAEDAAGEVETVLRVRKQMSFSKVHILYTLNAYKPQTQNMVDAESRKLLYEKFGELCARDGL